MFLLYTARFNNQLVIPVLGHILLIFIYIIKSPGTNLWNMLDIQELN